MLEAHKTGDTLVFNNAAQVWNHQFAWRCLRPGGGGAPPPDLEIGLAIAKQFGDSAAFSSQFKARACTRSALGNEIAQAACVPRRKRACGCSAAATCGWWLGATSGCTSTGWALCNSLRARTHLRKRTDQGRRQSSDQGRLPAAVLRPLGALVRCGVARAVRRGLDRPAARAPRSRYFMDYHSRRDDYLDRLAHSLLHWEFVDSRFKESHDESEWP
jgi:hypothetical protein